MLNFFAAPPRSINAGNFSRELSRTYPAEPTAGSGAVCPEQETSSQ
jgi:hypothetical protein